MRKNTYHGESRALNNCRKELLDFLKKPCTELRVVVMPDFFLDRLVSLDFDVPRFAELAGEVVKRKGGSIDSIPQADLRGGNAVNVASALAALDAHVTPIVCTSRHGLEQMRFHLKGSRVDLSHVKVLAKPSVTTALEFQTQAGKANVMLRDLGSLADFGPADLNETDYAMVEDADYMCLFNWAGTRKFGTELAEAVFSRAKKGKGKTYFDTADPTPNEAEIPQLMERVLQTRNVDILSVNENEAVTYAALLDPAVARKRSGTQLDRLAMEAARVLANRLSARIDLHTTAFAATVKGKREVVVPAFQVAPLRATGAGDAWDAGNVIGDGAGLSDECRLMLANAVAACYLSDAGGTHPTPQELAGFIANAVTK